MRKPFTCQNDQCKWLYGYTTDAQLDMCVTIGGLIVSLGSVCQRTALHCPRCKTITVWKRLTKGLAKSERMRYNTAVPL